MKPKLIMGQQGCGKTKLATQIAVDRGVFHCRFSVHQKQIFKHMQVDERNTYIVEDITTEEEIDYIKQLSLQCENTLFIIETQKDFTGSESVIGYELINLFPKETILTIRAKHFRNAVYDNPSNNPIANAAREYLNGKELMEAGEQLYMDGRYLNHEKYDLPDFEADCKLAENRNQNDVIRRIKLTEVCKPLDI